MLIIRLCRQGLQNADAAAAMSLSPVPAGFLKQARLQLLAIGLFAAAGALAQPLQPIADIASTPLPLTPAVEPNIMLVLDDSGSMDFEVITADVLSAGLFLAPNPNGHNPASIDARLQITHRAGCELKTAAFGGYAYGFSAPGNHYKDQTGGNCLVAAADAWRFRCAGFNPLYYNPLIKYQPWPGLREDATPFPDADPEAASLDPFKINAATVNLAAPDKSVIGVDAIKFYTCKRGPDGNFQRGQAFIIAASAAEANASAQLDNFANWFVYHRSRHLRIKALLGEFIVKQTGPHIGLTGFNDANLPGLPAEKINAGAGRGARSALLDALYSTRPAQLESSLQASPLAERYQQARDYLACDGKLFADNKRPCPVQAPPAGACQANHIIIASDGFHDRILGYGNHDGDNNSGFDGGIFADMFSNTLADIAMAFYESDLHPDLPDQVPASPIDRNAYTGWPKLQPQERIHQHIKTHIVTFKAPSNAGEMPAAPWLDPRLADQDLTADLVHAALNGRGEYIDAAASLNLTDRARRLADSMAPGAGSTAPVAINTQVTAGNAVLYRTFYDAFSRSGDVVAQQIITRRDGSLSIDQAGNARWLWSAAQQLDQLLNQQTHRGRAIFTYSNTDNAGINFLFDELDTRQAQALNRPAENINTEFLPIAKDRAVYLRGGLTAREGTNSANGEFRIRPQTNSTPGKDAGGRAIVHYAKLGAIANAAPVFVGRPNAGGRSGGAWPGTNNRTYRDFQTRQADRKPVLLAAANDGMLHVFDAATGSERFAYVPSFLFANLARLTLPDYRHQLYLDATPAVEDAYINIGRGAGWHTIVIGGLGAGGRGYYALDITDTASQIAARERVLWEFGPEDDPGAEGGAAGSDLGLTFARPVIAMSNASAGGEQKWLAVFGNGYNSTGKKGEAVIYMLFIDQGLDGVWAPGIDVIKINTQVAGIGTPNGIADVRAIDIDGNGTIDRLYAGDLQGNLHVVDISSARPADWALPANRFILFSAKTPDRGQPQPITTRPIVVRNNNGNGVIAVFATGSYFTRSDASNKQIQSLYGVADDLTGNAKVSVNDLIPRALVNRRFEDPGAGISLAVRTINQTPAALMPDRPRGWYINFDVRRAGSQGAVEFPGEKAIRALQLRNGVLFTDTVIPKALNCELPPGGFSLAIDPQTGTPASEVVFDINADNEFNEQDTINNTVSPEAGLIVGIRLKSTPADSIFFGDFRITQLADTDLHIIRANSRPSVLIGRQAWREVEF